MSGKKSKKGLTAFLIIISVIVVIIFGATLISIFGKTGTFNLSSNGDFLSTASSISFDNNLFSKKPKSIKGKYLAVIYIEGTIQKAGSTYNQEWLLNTIAKLKEDKKNEGILLFIDSPGGTVFESDEAYLTLQDYKTSGKKVYAYMGSLAASGGYYIACAADHITANRNTLTGSIGVIAGQSIDLSEFLEDHGIKYTTITAGKNKNMGNYNEPLSKEQKEILQSIADDCYGQFTSIVSSSRNIPYKEILPLCDGRIYTASQALKNGLVDSIATSYDSYLDFLLEEGQVFENCKIVNFRYTKQRSLMESLMGFTSKLSGATSNTIEGIPYSVWEEMNLKGPLYLYR